MCSHIGPVLLRSLVLLRLTSSYHALRDNSWLYFHIHEFCLVFGATKARLSRGSILAYSRNYHGKRDKKNILPGGTRGKCTKRDNIWSTCPYLSIRVYPKSLQYLSISVQHLSVTVQGGKQIMMCVRALTPVFISVH